MTERTAEIVEGDAPDEVSLRPTGWRFAVLVSVLAALLIGLVVTVVLLNDPPPPGAAVQIDRLQQGCREWVAELDGPNRPDDAWCSSMAAWMNDQLSPGSTPPGSMAPGSMMNAPMMGRARMAGPMMWQSPASMQQTCQEWVNGQPDATELPSDPADWCRRMVDWMREHRGNGDAWMTNGASDR